MRAQFLLIVLIALLASGCRDATPPEPPPVATSDASRAGDPGDSHGHDGHVHADQHVGAGASDAACVCDEGWRRNIWCAACRVGHVAGLRVPSADLFEIIDAHGHDIDPDSLHCTACDEALATDGYCPVHGWGFVDEKLYVSRLTWSLAHGERVRPMSLKCDTCRFHAATGGWCDDCGRGLAGSVAFDDRAMYDIAAAEFDRLVRAVATIQRCEECALRHFADGRCEACGLTWTNGQSSDS